eukprot:s5270_g6.t1
MSAEPCAGGAAFGCAQCLRLLNLLGQHCGELLAITILPPWKPRQAVQLDVPHTLDLGQGVRQGRFPSAAAANDRDAMLLGQGGSHRLKLGGLRTRPPLPHEQAKHHIKQGSSKGQEETKPQGHRRRSGSGSMQQSAEGHG